MFSQVKLPDDEYGSSYYYSSGGGCETPASEPGTDLLDQLLDSEDEDDQGIVLQAGGGGGGGGGGSRMMMGSNFKRTHQRRLSDPSSTLNDFMRFGVLDRPPSNKCEVAEDTIQRGAFLTFVFLCLHRPSTVTTTGSSLGLSGLGLGDSSSDLTAAFGDATCEIYAGDLLDEFEETKYNPLWTMRG